MIIVFHKPYGVLSQFTSDGSPNRTLADFGFPAHVYPVGRLDADSEGMLLLSDEPGFNTKLLDPRRGHPRCYWAQVERIPEASALEQLEQGVWIQDYRTRPAKAWLLDPQPILPERIPPIRVRQSIPDAWLALELIEGKNRQVRKMTAAVGHPTLRLIRVSIGRLELSDLAAGEWRALNPAEKTLLVT